MQVTSAGEPTEQTAEKPPEEMTGLFGTLCGRFHAPGSAAPISSIPARRLILTILCATVGVLAFSATAVQALETHVFVNSFTGAGTPAGSFADPNGVAVVEAGREPGEAGDLYVADIANNVVDKLGASGAYVSQITGAGTPAGSFAFPNPQGVATPTAAAVAVDNDPLSPSFGDLYVLDAGHGVIDKFDPSGKYVGQLTGGTGGPFVTAGLLGGPFGVAVDTGGNVWVYESNGNVDEFNAVGGFVKQFSTGCEGPEQGLAVDSSDDLYVICGGQIKKFSAVGVELEALPGGGTSGVAVDQADNHAFHALEGSTVEEFDSTGAPVSSFSAPSGTAGSDTGGLAVDGVSGDVYLSNKNTRTVYRWGPLVTLPDVTTGEASGVAPASATLGGVVNPDGVKVTACQFEYGTGVLYGQSVSCEHPDAGEIGEGTSPVAVVAKPVGLAADTTYHYRLLASNTNGSNPGRDQEFTTPGPPTVDEESSTNVTQTNATLQAQVNPHGFDTTYHFEYGTSAAYGTSIPIPAGDIGAGSSDEALSAEPAGLQAGVSYHYRVVAVNSQGTEAGFDETFTTTPSALIEGVSASNLTSSGVTLNARINPLSNETSYRFEYGTSTAYGTSIPVPDANVGSGSSPVAVSQTVLGLEPNVTYHYRVLAHNNALGTAASPDHTFIYVIAGAGLPDDRAYEMVTPSQKNGALIGAVPFSPPPVIAADGSRLIIGSLQCFAGAVSCVAERETTGSPYAFSRAGGGWAPTSLAPAATQFETNTWSLDSADQNTALFSAPTSPFGEDDFYARRPDGSFVDIGPVSPPSGGANVEAVENTFGSPLSMTADLSHILFEQANSKWSFGESEGQSLFEYNGSGNAAPVPIGVTGSSTSTDLISACQTELGGPIASGQSPQGAMSADGRTVYFTAGSNSNEGAVCPSGTGANAGTPVPVAELYARIDSGEATAHTVAISQPETLASAAPVQEGCVSAGCQKDITAKADWRNAEFVGASEDGAQVFFTSTQRLTDRASEDPSESDTALASGCSVASGANGCNLYEFENAAAENAAEHKLIDVSAGDGSGLGPRVQGVLAISSDGSHVYFVAKGVLTGAANAQGQSAQAGQENLYVYQRDPGHPEGRTAFIAGLPAADSPEWTQSPGHPANVTPDGRFLVFTSSGALTSDVTRGDGAKQVFRYDAQSEELVRISVGEHGVNDNGNAGAGDASIVEGARGGLRAGPDRTNPTMSDDGAYVFFMSPVGLTPQALDSIQIGTGQAGEPAYAQNVYEYHEGTVSLISDGRDTSVDPAQWCTYDISSVCLLGADASGHDAFFTTGDRLSARDTDTQLDIYDARICEPEANNPCIAPPVPAQPPCLGEACHGIPPATPGEPGGGSATLNGAGNLLPHTSKHAVKTKKCRTRSRRAPNHGRCVKAKAKRKKTTAKKAGHERRATR